MARTLARGPARLLIAAAAAAAALLVPGSLGQVVTILVAGRDRSDRVPRLGARAASDDAVSDRPPHRGRGGRLLRRPARRPAARRRLGSSHAVDLAASFYRAGALVFGGGHVVLPLLNDAVVETGWVSQQAFLAGYGAAQAVPGPLFTFSAYLGAIEEPSPNGVAGAAIALGAIFLPSFLLLGAVLPLWSAARERVVVQAAVGRHRRRGRRPARCGALGSGARARPCTGWATSRSPSCCSASCGSCRRGLVVGVAAAAGAVLL